MYFGPTASLGKEIENGVPETLGPAMDFESYLASV